MVTAALTHPLLSSRNTTKQPHRCFRFVFLFEAGLLSLLWSFGPAADVAPVCSPEAAAAVSDDILLTEDDLSKVEE